MTTEPPAEPPRRRRFGLSVRALMVLVLIVGGGIGWKANRAGRQRRAVATLDRNGVSIEYDHGFSGGRPWAPGWLRRAFGEECFREVTGVSDGGLAALRASSPAGLRTTNLVSSASDAGGVDGSVLPPLPPPPPPVPR